MAVLEVKELTKKYGEGESEVIALDHVSFSEKEENLLQSSEHPVLGNRHL